MERRRHEAEDRQRRVAAADVGRRLDDGAELLRAASSASELPGSVMAMKSRAGAISPIGAWKAFGSVVEPDLELTQKSVRAAVRPRPEAAHRVGMGRVEDPQLEPVASRPLAPKPRRRG